jgi:hypothetical protein
LGLLYIKEDCGPTSDLLCAVNTNPAIIETIPITINILLRCLVIPTYILPCIFHFRLVILLSARKSKLQKQEEEEHQRSQQVTRAPLFLGVCNLLDEYQNENNKKKGRKKATTERSLWNPEAMVDTNDLNRRREGRDLLLLSVTDVFPSANRFLKSANIQGAAITLLTVMFVSIQLLFSSSINILRFL